MKFDVTGVVCVTLTAEIEADTPEEAKEKGELKFIEMIKAGEVGTFDKDDLTDDIRVYDEDGNELLDHDDADPPRE